MIDDPSGTVPTSGTPLATATMMGPAGPDGYTYLWTRNVVSLDGSGSTNGQVSVLIDLIQGTYAVFDNQQH